MFLRQNLADQATHMKARGKRGRGKREELVSTGGYSFIYRIRENRAKRRDKSESRFRNLFISPCVARHCFFREKKACRLGIKRARWPKPFHSSSSPHQPLDKATFSLCSLNHANPAYNAYLLFCFSIKIKWKKKKRVFIFLIRLRRMRCKTFLLIR